MAHSGITPPDSHEDLMKISCKCLASRAERDWLIEAESFLCGHRHKQGDVVSQTEEARNAMIEAEWDRAEAEYLGQTS